MLFSVLLKLLIYDLILMIYLTLPTIVISIRFYRLLFLSFVRFVNDANRVGENGRKLVLNELEMIFNRTKGVNSV